MSLHCPFGHLKHKLWPKERTGVKLPIWLPTLVSMRADSVRHIVEKLSIRATTLLETSSQSKVCMQSYGAPKLQESQPWQFRDSHLGVPGQKTIWMWAPWRGVEYTIRGKVVASPKSRSWWVLCVRVAHGSS